MAKIGFIGTGIMGKPIAKNLQNAGHSLFFSEHRSQIPSELIGNYGTVLKNPEMVAKTAEFIILMLPGTPQVEEVLFSNNGVAPAVESGKTIIDMSSISPIASKGFAARIKQTGAEYLDAPVSGGEVGAISGNLTIMVGGSQEAYDNAESLFQIIGHNITRVGCNGDGQIAKIANQIIVALSIEAVSEALLFASKAGAKPEKVQQALMGGFAASKILEVHGERMLKGSFNPGFRINQHQKDLDLALAHARELKLNLPNTAQVQQLFNTCCSIGGADWDHSAMIRALEHLANHSIRDR